MFRKVYRGQDNAGANDVCLGCLLPRPKAWGLAISLPFNI